MRIGTRWRAGEKPHDSVPAVVHEFLAEAENRFAAGRMWTLTWLEGLPVCTLDDLCSVTVSGISEISGADETETAEEDDSWLL